MNFLKSFICILLSVATSYASDVPIGFGQLATGGKNGTEYHVNSFTELVEVLKFNNRLEEPKIIYIDSPINGLEAKDGHIIDAKEISKDYNIELYTACFGSDGNTWNSNSTFCGQMEIYRKSIGRTKQGYQIKTRVHSNISIIGNGVNSTLENVSFQIKDVHNVILKNLYIKSPVDFFSEWDPNDEGGKWKADYDSVFINNGTNVWIDNCYFTDGDMTPDKYEIYLNKPVEVHDGFIDISKESDNITISNNRFESHEKISTIGSSDSYTKDYGHLKVTLYNNVFINVGEQIPYVRYGKIHIFNNYYYITKQNEYKFDYFFGLGKKCNVLSEFNSFNYIGDDSNEIKFTKVFNNDTTFHDNGSEYNGKKIDIDKITDENNSIKISSTEAFNPNEYYDYSLDNDFNKINDLINNVPSWVSEIKLTEDILDTDLKTSGANSLINMSKVNLLIIMVIFSLIILI